MIYCCERAQKIARKSYDSPIGHLLFSAVSRDELHPVLFYAQLASRAWIYGRVEPCMASECIMWRLFPEYSRYRIRSSRISGKSLTIRHEVTS